MVLRRIFRPKGSEIIGDWRKLYNEKLRNLYSSPSILRAIKSGRIWAGHAARVREKRKIYIIFVGRKVKLSVRISY
jgi:hypothetical protein